uniref:SFRICE_017425 n=1 Tax=Spodoptera frugiperda TaxID=7108 RepID=A0A2H1WQ24_SPOFR
MCTSAYPFGDKRRDVVCDKQTGDSKTVQESRDGGVVRGYYSFIDADGKTRTVHYTADDTQGFRANVQKTN